VVETIKAAACLLLVLAVAGDEVTSLSWRLCSSSNGRTELIAFTPTEALNATMAVIGKKLAAAVGMAAQGPEPYGVHS
jgi:hypothetical protein